MAITNTVTPAYHLLPVYNAIEFTFTSDNSGEDNFLMRCQVKNAAGVVLDTLYVDNDGAGNFIFDVAPSLRPSLSETILALATTALTTNNTGSNIKFTLTLTEIYDDVDGLPQEGDSLNVTVLGGQEMWVFNMVARTGEDIETDFQMTYNTDFGRFLTDRPSTCKATALTYMQLSFISHNASVYATVTRNLIGGGTSGYSTTHIPFVGRRYVLPLNSTALAANVESLDIVIKSDATDEALSETLHIPVEQVQATYAVTLMFKNHLGGFDTYTFRDYERVSSPRNTTFKTSTTKKTFFVEPESVYELTGRYEHTDVLAWLDELYNSKSVYMISGTELIQVNIIPGSYNLGGFDFAQPRVRIEIQPSPLN